MRAYGYSSGSIIDRVPLCKFMAFVPGGKVECNTRSKAGFDYPQDETDGSERLP